MSAVVIIAIILLVLGPTVVFYAAKMPGTLPLRTAIAAVGFLVIVIGLYLVGALT